MAQSDKLAFYAAIGVNTELRRLNRKLNQLERKLENAQTVYEKRLTETDIQTTAKELKDCQQWHKRLVK